LIPFSSTIIDEFGSYPQGDLLTTLQVRALALLLSPAGHGG